MIIESKKNISYDQKLEEKFVFFLKIIYNFSTINKKKKRQKKIENKIVMMMKFE